MADRVMKKYKALVEKTIYVAEEVEILAETERQAEEILDNYCVALEDSSDLKVVEVDEQETTVDYQSITSSEELGVDEFMEYRDNLH